MRILLTGGSGFLGRSIFSTLLRGRDHPGLLMRNNGTVTPDVETFVLGPGPWSEADISTALKCFQPDAIIHLAGSRQSNHLTELYESNTFQGIRLMAAAKKVAPDAVIVLAGSAAEYGVPVRDDGVSRESDPCHPLTGYGISKLAQTLHGIANTKVGQRIIVARLFNLVGRDQPIGFIFADVAQKISLGLQEIPVGNIDVARDFLSVEEAARILRGLVDCPAAVGKVVNVCSGAAQPLKVGLDRLISRSGTTVKLVMDPTLVRGNDVPVICGCTKLLESLDIKAASSDIGAELDSLMDRWLSRI